jgi:hypothetical protein
MRKFAIPVAALVALACASAAVASGDSSERFGEGGSGPAVTVFGKTAQLNLLDLGDPGFTLGDQIAFTDDLFTRANGKPAGSDGGACTLVRVTDAAAQSGVAQCQVTYSLERGQITTQGLLTLTNGGFVGTQVVAITGGTGRFSQARGESTLEFVRPGELNITLAIGA